MTSFSNFNLQFLFLDKISPIKKILKISSFIMVLPGVYIVFDLDRQILQKCRRLLHVSVSLAVTRVATWTCVWGVREDTHDTRDGSIVRARASIIPCSAQLISIATASSKSATSSTKEGVILILI